MSLPEAGTDETVPLCVDLDGTLIRADVSMESALDLLRQNPLNAIRFGVWLLRGKAAFKREVARRTDIDATILPYDERVLDWLRSQPAARRRVLCTASDQKFADAVATHVNLFDEAIGSDGANNLSGSGKARALCERFGERGFDYAGNAAPDLRVWRVARRAIVVNAAPSVARQAAKTADVAQIFASSQTGWRTQFAALRLYQWLKNLLVFLPLITAHKLFDLDSVLLAVLAFFSFGLCASGVYLLNDMLDLAADRRHPRKRLRPFASGSLSLTWGLLGVPLLTLAAFALALLVTAKFAAVLLGYYVLTLAYSFAIKRIAMLDIVVLTSLYTVRIIAGTAAIHVPISFWLLAFSMFLFLSLALVKRCTELHMLRLEGRTQTEGRGYQVDDLGLMQSLGSASGYLAVLVLALYINSTASEALYRHPQVLWLLCPLLLYWISRVWLKSHRGIMNDDPVLFALTDRVSRAVLVLCTLVVVAAL